MKLAVSYIMESFPCFGRDRWRGGHMRVSEQRTVNYPVVEVKKKRLWQVLFWTKNYALIVRKNSHNIFPLLTCGSELLHRFAFYLSVVK